MDMSNSSGPVQAESVRREEEERMKQEAKEATLRAAKERLERLQSTWREDQQLKEVCMSTPPFTCTCSIAPGFVFGCPTCSLFLSSSQRCNTGRVLVTLRLNRSPKVLHFRGQCFKGEIGRSLCCCSGTPCLHTRMPSNMHMGGGGGVTN